MTWLPSDHQLHSMALAFLHRMTTAILEADGELSPSELVFLDQEFPAHKLVMAGFVRPTTSGYTFAYYQAFARAFAELPGRLEHAERASLFGQLTRAATSSGGDITVDEHELLAAVKAWLAGGH